MAVEQDLFPGTFPALFAGRPPPDPDALRAPGRLGADAPGSPTTGRSTPERLLALAGAVALAAGGYTVDRGDTLSEISLRLDVPLERLAEANGIVNLDRIYVGQRLRLPGGGRDGGSSAGGSGGATTTHVVQHGETLGEIAGRYGLTVRRIAAANGITDPGHILAGSRLTLRDAPATPRPTTTVGSHTVARGETLSGIAVRYGVPVARLAAANGIADPDIIVVGTKLRVPGGWQCPVRGAEFLDDFGVAKPDGRTHEGIDLFAPRGTPARAPVPGRVEQVRGDRGGKQFFLHGDDDRLYIGTHLDALVGSDGRVRAGQVLGRVGTTGNARGTSPHLHFEVEVDGTDVNPYSWLVESCR